MKLKFKLQPHQTAAVDAVIDCFAGQPWHNPLAIQTQTAPDRAPALDLADGDIFGNAPLSLSPTQLLSNIQRVQRRQNLPVSASLAGDEVCPVNLDIEMETGTGKTYCYIKTLFELNQRYGWSKFIVVVPGIAIREGVDKSLRITAAHFAEIYGKKARCFIYNSRQPQALEQFASDAGIHVMIINTQAFNAAGKDNRRIYEALDAFRSRRPIDVLSACRPILILDEPQRMEGKKTLSALAHFTPLAVLRYSATHKTNHNKIHRLDALDAYNQKLVKKIAVRGIAVKGAEGLNAWLWLESIELSQKAPLARIEMEIKTRSGIRRALRRLQAGNNLYAESNQLEQYRGYIVEHIDAISDSVSFTNGQILRAGEAVGDVSDADIRRLQIRETVRAHLEKERQLYPQGIKVLSLFFIDEVAKYRDYARDDEKGDYARLFEQEYQAQVDALLAELPPGRGDWRDYLASIRVDCTHKGYFSVDKKSQRLRDPDVKTRGEDAGLSDDVDAYDLILKDKERLLSFQEPTRFIFSHSALREGWDNPNVFVMCMLKRSNSGISRRQEVGRGLRLAVNQRGERQDNPATVHDINVLCVVASESYRDFVCGLQQELGSALSARPRKANEAWLTGKLLIGPHEETPVTPEMAKRLYKYLVKHDYINELDDTLTLSWHTAVTQNTLAPLPDALAPWREAIIALLNTLFSEAQLPAIEDNRRLKINPLNALFDSAEFQALWAQIHHKSVWRVEFDTPALIRQAVQAIDTQLRVTPLQYTLSGGEQTEMLTDELLHSGGGFRQTPHGTVRLEGQAIARTVRYDLPGKLAAATALTRRTLVAILRQISPHVFALYQQNPEAFIAGAARLINEQKAALSVENLTYTLLDECYDRSLFIAGQRGQDLSRAAVRLQKHIYDYAVLDSGVERRFAEALESCDNVAVYAKLPHGFAIPTPLGDYIPDWAIAFREGSVRHLWFVAETKGSDTALSLRASEAYKIACARRFFAALNKESADVHYACGYSSCSGRRRIITCPWRMDIRAFAWWHTAS